jgi:hypothetical protein
MNHYDDVSPGGKRAPVASLLVRAIAAIHRVNLHLHSIKCARDRDSLISAAVVHHDNKIDNAVRHHLLISLSQRAGRIISRHHYDNLLAV